MAILGLCAEELAGLCQWLLMAIDGDCIPEWEFDSLVGCSMAEARSWVESGVPGAELDERLLDQVVTLLSMLAGSTHGAGRLGNMQVEQLMEKLFWSSDEERSARAHPHSSVGLRPDVQLQVLVAARLPTRVPAVKPARKRRAVQRAAAGE